MLTADKFQSLIEAQKSLEDSAIKLGVDRFNASIERNKKRGEETGGGGALKLLQGALSDNPETKEPSKFMEAMRLLSTGRESHQAAGGRPHQASRWVAAATPEVACYVTMKVLLNGVSNERPLRKVAREVADLIVDELRFRAFSEAAPRLFDYKMSTFNTSSYAHMSKAMSAAISSAWVKVQGPDGKETKQKLDFSHLEMNDEERMKVGNKLVDVALQTTSLFVVEDREEINDGHRTTHKIIKGSEEAIKWMGERNHAIEALWPINLPMVVPPNPWGPGMRGGYKFRLRNKHPLVRGISREWRKELESLDMPVVYTAINRIQETAWRVNTKVLSVVENLLEMGGGYDVLPLTKKEGSRLVARDVDVDQECPKPDSGRHNPELAKKCPLPEDFHTNGAAREAWVNAAWKPWRELASEIHENNHNNRQELVELNNLLRVVDIVKDYEAIWFPHTLDFRGRVYPITSFLNPQGGDLVKGLLTFAQGKPLGADGAGWLALHGANSMGKDPHGGMKMSKLTLQSRVNWVIAYTQEIEAVAKDPIENRKFWTQADDPFLFLAFCFDWAGFMEMERKGLGAEYVSSLPIAQDGTCNGLQHYAAMFLDETTAKSVNVYPNESPSDVYERVALDSLDELVKLAATDPWAALWLKSHTEGLTPIDRSMAKPNVMTFAYGSKQYGFKDQLDSYYKTKFKKGKKWKAIKEHFTGPVTDPKTKTTEVKVSPNTAFGLMAKLNWESLGKRVVAAKEGMEWMSKVARCVSKDRLKRHPGGAVMQDSEGKDLKEHGTVLQWEVPGTGFKVRQEYYKEKKRQIETKLLGKIYRMDSYSPADGFPPDTNRQGSAAPPNIVHSFDAGVLMCTVDLASRNGITEFGMIHDSYSTVAADAGSLAHYTRQAFFEFYDSTDVVGSLQNQFLKLVEDSPEKLKDFPQPPGMGSLDLSGVLKSDYFFN